MVDHCDIGLVAFDDISKKTSVGIYVLFELTIDCLETGLVVLLGFAFSGHDVVD